MPNNNFIPWLGNSATSGNQSIYETIAANGFQVNGPIRADQNNAALRMSSWVAASVANAMPAFASKTIDSAPVDLSGTILGANVQYNARSKDLRFNYNRYGGSGKSTLNIGGTNMIFTDFRDDDDNRIPVFPGLYYFRFKKTATNILQTHVIVINETMTHFYFMPFDTDAAGTYPPIHKVKAVWNSTPQGYGQITLEYNSGMAYYGSVDAVYLGIGINT